MRTAVDQNGSGLFKIVGDVVNHSTYHQGQVASSKTMTTLADQFAAFYAAFNARDLTALMAGMVPDVDWANGMTGGRVHGRDAVRAYWEAQWLELDPRVQPVRVEADRSGAVVVDVHQVVRDRTGVVLLDRMVRHVYELRDGLVARMDIEDM